MRLGHPGTCNPLEANGADSFDLDDDLEMMIWGVGEATDATVTASSK